MTINVLTDSIHVLINKEDIEKVHKGLRQFKGTYYIKRKENCGEVFFYANSLEEIAKAAKFLANFE